ncbi:MAG: DUF4156 domain-containing protein [Betaproteobacteria bacterium]|nr:DUF4156 domain-containing protein [Betaproteobacteria bacterium]
MKKILIVICGGLILSSCTWVKVTTRGESVRLVQSVKTVESCKKLGKVNTKVVDQIIFHRDADKVAEELADLARNEAGLMGGDTIVPASEIIDGRRSFDVYQCFQSKRTD